MTEIDFTHLTEIPSQQECKENMPNKGDKRAAEIEIIHIDSGINKSQGLLFYERWKKEKSLV